MIISLIVAADLDGAIARDGAMPWRLREDLKRFRSLTLGHPVIMGRKTFESIGKPLEGRSNIVLSRRPGWNAEGALVVTSLDEALILCEVTGQEQVFICGGGEVYAKAWELADTLYLTTVLAHVEGDVFIPTVSPDTWLPSGSTRTIPEDPDNTHPTTFQILTRG